MNLVVIPTFNRSYKLGRVLDFYGSHPATFRVVVLDASTDEKHQAMNQASVDRHKSFARRVPTPHQRDVVERLLSFLGQIDEEFVAIGTDEDAFFPAFLDAAFEHLRRNPGFVAATGKYVTFARPILGLKRVSFWTDSFVGFDIDNEEPALRVVNFQRANSAGVPPLFWSVRRKIAFIESMKLGMRLSHGSGQEFLDQINTCVMGKVWISDLPMLLRDESRLQYKPEKHRDTGKLYIGEKDLAEIVNIARESWGDDVTVAVRTVTSWFLPNRNGESYESRLGTRHYCRFNPVPDAGDSRLLGGLQKAIRWSCVLGQLLAQFFAYLYYARYMTLKGKGRMFAKLSRAVVVNK
jgi:glycosyltransferase domain-containing protein